MRDRPRIFWTNYHKIKKIKENTTDEFRQVLYPLLKGIESGQYNQVDSSLRLCPTSMIEANKDLITKALTYYLRAYNATIPYSLTKEGWRDIETDRKELEKLVESFYYRPRRNKK